MDNATVRLLPVPTRVLIKVSNLSVIMRRDENGLGRMTENAIDTIAGIRCGIIIDQLHGYFACLGVVDDCLQWVVGGNELICILHYPIDWNGDTIVYDQRNRWSSDELGVERNVRLKVDCNGWDRLGSHNRTVRSAEHESSFWPDVTSCQTASVCPSSTLHKTFESGKEKWKQLVSLSLFTYRKHRKGPHLHWEDSIRLWLNQDRHCSTVRRTDSSPNKGQDR